MKKMAYLLGGLLLATLLLLGAGEVAVRTSAADRIYEDVDAVPHRRVGLVLGTSPVSSWTGRRNLYFERRMEAAAQLYHAGKVERLVVSGGDYRDTEANGYDEPAAMRDSLVVLGVDPAHITLDYDGTRTLLSVAKMRDIYRQDSFLIISQHDHNERALYQARRLGLDALAFDARTPVGRRSIIWWRNRGRETAARLKTVAELLFPPTLTYADSVNAVATPPFPYPLRTLLDWDATWPECRGQEPLELTDSLRHRIGLFVARDPNYIVYSMDRLGCYTDIVEYDLPTILDDRYTYTEDDLAALDEYLCRNTAVYNEVGTRYRYTRHDGRWPY